MEVIGRMKLKLSEVRRKLMEVIGRMKLKLSEVRRKLMEVIGRMKTEVIGSYKEVIGRM